MLQATQSENERMARTSALSLLLLSQRDIFCTFRKSPMPTSPDMGRKCIWVYFAFACHSQCHLSSAFDVHGDRKRGGGLMAEYESTMPKFNLAGSAPAASLSLSNLLTSHAA